MEQIPTGPLVYILGKFSSSPITALNLAATSKTMFEQLQGAWPGLFQHWALRFGDPSLQLETENPRDRKSKRLKAHNFYTHRFQFIRLIRLGRSHAVELTTELTALNKPLTVSRFNHMANSFLPLWLNGKDNFVAGAILTSKHLSLKNALPLTEELLKWEADISSNSCLLSIASAKGFDSVVELLLKQRACNKTCVYKAMFVFQYERKRIRISGSFSPLEWAVQVLHQFERQHVEVDAAVLHRYQRCISLLSHTV